MQPYLNEIQLEKLNGHLEIILNDLKFLKRIRYYQMMNQKKIKNC